MIAGRKLGMGKTFNVERFLSYFIARRLVFCLALFCFALANPSLARAKTRSMSRTQSPNASRADIIVIDPGHGGFDRGGIPGQRVPEKMMALDVALRLRQKLQAAGYRVVMTRDSDVFIPLPARVAIANHYRDAVFICVHFNSATRSGANGIETYYYRRDSVTLASNIHKNVIADAPSENRGIRRRGYYVLRRTSIPGVLVECGFLTNPTEARLAQTSSYRDKLAENIARGILGKPPTIIRPPASRDYPAATEVERQPFSTYMGTDFIRVPPERTSRSHRRSSKSSRKKKKSSQHSGSSTKKKKSTKKSED
jgi:N-acetylmuramoyl-L-alanine amidase